MASIHRLSVDDRVMLWPDALWPQEVAALAILDGTNLLDSDGRLRLDKVRAMIGSRLYLVPRLRQLLYRPRRGLGGPLWVDAPSFDLAQHVLSVPVPPPGDEAALLSAVERLRRQRLDPTRPLWLMCLLTGLPNQQLGLFVKIHHAVTDGVAALATVGAFLDTAPDFRAASPAAIPSPTAAALDPADPADPTEPAATPEPMATIESAATPDSAVASVPSWRPEPWPTTVQLVADNARRHAVSLWQMAATLAHPVATARWLRAAWSQMRTFSSGPADPPSSLDHPLTADRRLALVRASLGQVAETAHTNGATINDVLLAATTGGLRALLHARGEPADHPVNIDVPITLRPKESRDRARGNKIAQMLIALPVYEADPMRRLELIAAQTSLGKRESRPSAGRMLGSRLARRFVLKALRRHPVNVTSADLTGPAQPVYLAGARVLEVFPMLPLMGNICLGVGALSCAGQFTIGVIADRDAYPDLDVFTAALRAELTEFGEPAGPAAADRTSAVPVGGGAVIAASLAQGGHRRDPAVAPRASRTPHL